METKDVFSVRVDKEIWKKGKKFAIDHDISMSQFVESAIIHELQR